MSAGLAASTVTPGSTAPVASFTTPAIPPEAEDCALAVFPNSVRASAIIKHAPCPILDPRIRSCPPLVCPLVLPRCLSEVLGSARFRPLSSPSLRLCLCERYSNRPQSPEGEACLSVCLSIVYPCGELRH